VWTRWSGGGREATDAIVAAVQASPDARLPATPALQRTAPLFTNSASALLTPGQEEIVAMARSMPNWQALQAGIAGEVVLPGSAAYQEIPKPFNARFHDVRPQAIVLCATPQDVAETISFARRHSLACATRSDGLPSPRTSCTRA
jgi:hypothetical protein